VRFPRPAKLPGAERAGFTAVVRNGYQSTVPGFRASALGLDRALEYRLLGQLAPLALAPAPLAVDPARGLLLRAWVPGPTWADGRGPSLEQAAAALARVHAVTLPPGEVPVRDWAGTIARYAALAGPAGAATAARARAALDQLPPSDPAAAVLCHHDPLPANVLGAGVFLDWEYALAGNPLFDVAVLGLGLGLTGEKDWARLAAAWAAHRPGSAPAGRYLPAWARFAHAVGDLWVAAITGPSAD
jgi:aminoglycoside phosphotransferase (APT) family kinase protein